MSIPDSKIKAEEYILITTCMRCYKVEDHYTKDCKNEEEYKICSECASVEHTWRVCNTDLKKCINCNGNHRTLAYNCPVKKKERKKNRHNRKLQINPLMAAQIPTCQPNKLEHGEGHSINNNDMYATCLPNEHHQSWNV